MAAAHVSRVRRGARHRRARGKRDPNTVQPASKALGPAPHAQPISPHRASAAGIVDPAARRRPDQIRPAPPAMQARRLPGQPSGRSDDDHAAGRVVRDVVRHAAEQEPAGTGHPLVADHDQVGADLSATLRIASAGSASTGWVSPRPRLPATAAAPSRTRLTSSRGPISCWTSVRGPDAARPRSAAWAPARRR